MATPAAAKVIAEALALSDEERAAVAEELLASLDPTQPDDSPEALPILRERLHEVRMEELDRATEIIGLGSKGGRGFEERYFMIG